MVVCVFGQWYDKVVAIRDAVKVGTTTTHNKKVRVARNKYSKGVLFLKVDLGSFDPKPMDIYKSVDLIII